MYFFIQYIFFTDLFAICKKKILKNYNIWVNTKFVTKVFCKISRLSDLNYLQKFVGFLCFLPREREGYQKLAGKYK